MAIKIEFPLSLLESKLFTSLRNPEMKLMVEIARSRTFKVGESLMTEGEVGEEFFWLASGSVEVRINKLPGPATLPVTLNALSAGAVLGEMCLLGKAHRMASVIVRSEVQAYCWNHKTCMDLFNDHPILGYRVMRNLSVILADRLKEMNSKIRDESESSGVNKELLKLFES